MGMPVSLVKLVERSFVEWLVARYHEDPKPFFGGKGASGLLRGGMHGRRGGYFGNLICKQTGLFLKKGGIFDILFQKLGSLFSQGKSGPEVWSMPGYLVEAFQDSSLRVMSCTSSGILRPRTWRVSEPRRQCFRRWRQWHPPDGRTDWTWKP